jgi:hypothetical protein
MPLLLGSGSRLPYNLVESEQARPQEFDTDLIIAP